jgi:hypothetical protein
MWLGLGTAAGGRQGSKKMKIAWLALMCIYKNHLHAEIFTPQPA